MQTEAESKDDFVTFPANNGGAVLARRSEIAGGRPNDNGCILYLRSGPSVYVAATIAQVGRALGAEAAELRRE
jgi:hypothetical protein